VEELRTRIAAHMLAHQAEYAPFVTNESGENSEGKPGKQLRVNIFLSLLSLSDAS
jgi:hypothetical protein